MYSSGTYQAVGVTASVSAAVPAPITVSMLPAGQTAVHLRDTLAWVSRLGFVRSA